MRVFLSVVLIPCAIAYDAVIFSNEQKITSEFPSVENLLSTASPESPVVFFVNPDFTLGQFSQHVNAYSDDKKVVGLPASVKDSQYHAARFLDDGVYTSSAEEVTSVDGFKTDQSVYIVAGESWATLDALSQQILSKLGNKFTGIITTTEAVSKDKTRVKRVSVKTGQFRDAVNFEGEILFNNEKFPIVIPPYTNLTNASVKYTPDKYGSCLLYSEGINIVVYNKNGKPNQYATIEVRPNNATWSFQDGDVSCPLSTVGNYVFKLNINTNGELNGYAGLEKDIAVKLATTKLISFTLNVLGDNMGYWKLTNVKLNENITISKGNTNFISGDITTKAGNDSLSVDYMGLNSVQGWAWGCSYSQAVFFPTEDPNYLIGISFYNTEIQTLGVISNTTLNNTVPANVKFTLNMDDCTGTFSPGSWMGIISVIVMLIGLFFGYIMLQAVNTMDRFDDPKQKQIIINVRE